MAFTLLGFSMNNAMELSLNTSSSISQFQPFLQHTNVNLRMEVRFNRSKSFTVTRMSSPISCCSSDSAISATPYTSSTGVPRMIRKRRRYRKLNPGEKEGITEEMRFVAMKLRNVKGKRIVKDDGSDEEDNDTDESTQSDSIDDDDENGETWQPSLEGFVKFLVDSQLVFNTIERIVDESSDVSYVYFRKTGLERSEALSEDLEWFKEQKIEIPEPSSPGVSYAKYLEELAETSAPLFLSHFYNIYFAHIAGGQVIAKKVSKKILEGKELKFTEWEEGEAEECLKGVREKLNMLGEHWARDDKNKCLREATKSFRFQGQIIRHIIL
ncbi:probable inactive heme oxygenase 2, chloroplastic [Impatiens glandulifera]|uniref:probable inactive heme oxygenase 2, chloroplastic n=1 Tax=Impatiens glandulifera TaxID=253017 RepID=UPI001FB17338|nr:probable inactive heme oxygenase 2, chloroplastic [Impatiens glandulifera]